MQKLSFIFHMDTTVYEDKPTPDIWIKLIILLPSAILLVSAIGLYADGHKDVTLYMAGFALLLGFAIQFLIPRRYCIHDSSIRIMLGGPLAFNIPFKSVSAVRPARSTTVGVNFPANFKQSHALEIVRRRSLPVTITPDDPPAFIQNFDKAFSQWKAYGEKLS